MLVRAATGSDEDALWAILEPMIRAGTSYALPRDMTRGAALAYWLSPANRVFVADDAGVVGTYYLRPNYPGGGAHVANCGYVTAPHAVGRGVARAMCEHSIALSRQLGYRAMQFNFVVSTNVRAIRLWNSFGFRTVGRLPKVFLHPSAGYVDAIVMHLPLAGYEEQATSVDRN
jgi:ribosomal protein S18 acetylase RimI-like enzyme